MDTCVCRRVQRWLRAALARANRETGPRKVESVERPRVRLPETHREAAERLSDPPAIGSAEYKRRAILRSREGADARILDFTRAMIRELERHGMPFYPNEFARSDERQDTLYARGVTRAKAGQSPHNFGMAVDIVHYSRYWDLTRREWEVVGAIGKEVARRRNLKITWGGDFKSLWDPAHWELRDWRAEIEARP